MFLKKMYKKQDTYCTCFRTQFYTIFVATKNKKMLSIYQFSLGFTVVAILYLVFKIIVDLWNQD